MIYKLLKDGEVVNTIVGSAAFVTAYCEAMGYTYELVPEPEPEPTDSEPVDPEPSPDGDQTNEQAIWDAMAQAYNEGVQGA